MAKLQGGILELWNIGSNLATMPRADERKPRSRRMAPTIEGECESRFAGVKQAFIENFERRGEVGAAVAVTINGRPVVDLWAGHADAARTRQWRRDTIVN